MERAPEIFCMETCGTLISHSWPTSLVRWKFVQLIDERGVQFTRKSSGTCVYRGTMYWEKSFWVAVNITIHISSMQVYCWRCRFRKIALHALQRPLHQQITSRSSLHWTRFRTQTSSTLATCSATHSTLLSNPATVLFYLASLPIRTMLPCRTSTRQSSLQTALR